MSIESTYNETLEEYAQSELAKNYPVVRSRRHLIELQHILAHLPPKGTLLDIGCGSGMIPRTIHKLGYTVIAVDFEDTGGNVALKRLMLLGIEGHFCEVGVTPMPLEDKSVDFVHCGDIIEHLAHSPKRFLEDVRRVLKSDGCLLVDTKNAVDLITRLKVLIGISNWTPINAFFHSKINPFHHKEYTLQELNQVLELAEFKTVKSLAFECRLFRSLKKLRTWQAMGAMSVGQRNLFGTGFNPLHPLEYIRIILLVFALIFPTLRSDILVIGRKSDAV